MTGSYVCQYNMSNSKSGNSSAQFFNYHPISENVLSAPFSDHVIPSMAPHMMDTIYIFVNDIYNLMVPFEGQTEFFFIALFQHHPATIPCRPTFSKATVRLLKMQTKEGEAPQEIKPNATLGISYNPKKGFYFELARWDSDSNLLQCHYEMDGISSTTAVNIHWSCKCCFSLFLQVFIGRSCCKRAYMLCCSEHSSEEKWCLQNSIVSGRCAQGVLNFKENFGLGMNAAKLCVHINVCLVRHWLLVVDKLLEIETWKRKMR